jgi:hypothetical protein
LAEHTLRHRQIRHLRLMPDDSVETRRPKPERGKQNRAEHSEQHQRHQQFH